MYKEAFIPVTPFRVKDKEEYHSEPGIMKRKTNRSLSIITGATAGALAGMALGTLAGQALGKRHPGLFDGNVKRYLDTAKKTGFHPAKEYIQSHVRKHGVKPTKIPVELHAPIAGLVLGSVAGALPAEHMAIRRMEKRVGIKPTTSGEYLKKEVTPYVAGATASLVVSDGLSKILSKYPNALGIDIGEVMPLASGAAYTAAKNITRNVMDGKYKADIVNVIKGKQAGDRNMEKDIVIDKIIKIAVDLGYYGEMGEMQKEAATRAAKAAKLVGKAKSMGGKYIKNLTGSSVRRAGKMYGKTLDHAVKAGLSPRETAIRWSKNVGADVRARKARNVTRALTGAAAAGTGGALLARSKRKNEQ